MNLSGTPKWQSGVLEDKTGSVSYTVSLADGLKRLPVETEGTEPDQRRQLQQPVQLPQPPPSRRPQAREQRSEEKRTVDVRSNKDGLVTRGAGYPRPVHIRKPQDRPKCSPV